MVAQKQSTKEEDGFSTLAFLTAAAATAAFVLTTTRLMRRLSLAELPQRDLEVGPETTAQEAAAANGSSSPPLVSPEDVASQAPPAPADEDDLVEAADGLVPLDDGVAAPSSNGANGTPQRPRHRLLHASPVRRRRFARRLGLDRAVDFARQEEDLVNAPEAAEAADSLPEGTPREEAEPEASVEAVEAEEETPAPARNGSAPVEGAEVATAATEEPPFQADAADQAEAAAGSDDAPEGSTSPALVVATDAPSGRATAYEEEELWSVPFLRPPYMLAGFALLLVVLFFGADLLGLAIRAVVAAVDIQTQDDLLIRGWLLCGAMVFLPVGRLLRACLGLLALAFRVGPLALVRRLRGEQPAAADASPGRSSLLPAPLRTTFSWAVGITAYVGFLFGAVYYTPRTLVWALDTDYPLAAITSSSMWPELRKGELVLIEGVDKLEDLRVGDIIAYTYKEGFAIHRVVEIENETITTKGDANRVEDPTITFANVVGRVLTVGGHNVKVPYLGNVPLLAHRTTDVEPASPATFEGVEEAAGNPR